MQTPEIDNSGRDDSYRQMIASLGRQGVANQGAVGEVRNWLHEQPGHEDAGHVGDTSDRITRTLTLWWHRPDNPDAVTILDRVREQARRRDVTVVVMPVPWTQAMIRRAAEVVFGPGGPALLGFAPIGMEGPQPPTGVLVIGGDLPGASRGELLTLARRAQATLALPVPIIVRDLRPRNGPWG